MTLRSVVLGGVLIVGVSSSCASPELAAHGDEQDLTASRCSIFNNQTGKPITNEELARLDDPVAKKILAGEDCPNAYSAVVAKLERNDATGCRDFVSVAADKGTATVLVNEQLARAPASEVPDQTFRTVTARRCDNRKTDGLLFSGTASRRAVSETAVEMIGKDRTSGVFNFYEVLPGGQWIFYGTSKDFIENGYDCKASGFCVSKNSAKASSPSKKSCASCHVSGGLVMKELETPWVHWATASPNASKFNDAADAVVAAHGALLGRRESVANLEIDVVRPSFEGYNDRRIGILAAKGAIEILRPLFCTMDINLSSGGISTTANGTALPSLLVADRVFLTRDFLPITFDVADYRDLKREVRQRIHGRPASVDDTDFAFTVPTRGEIERSYVAALGRAGLVDEELALDILDVDFTRPIFSGQRCALVQKLQGRTAGLDGKLTAWAKEPDGPRKQSLAKEIAAELPRVLTGALSTPASAAERKLLANLTDGALDATAHRNRVRAFVQTCRTRLLAEDPASRKAALRELMTYASHVRRVMRSDVVGKNGQDLLEGGGRDDKMVTDDIADTANAFDPESCQLTLGPADVK